MHIPTFVAFVLTASTFAASVLGQASPGTNSERPAAPTATPQEPPAADRAGVVGQGAVRTPKLVKRVGGDRDIAIDVVEGVYRCDKSMIESPLPDGYPEPTPPGAIDIKEYPSVRRAELVSKDDSGQGMVSGFFPLFRHIKKREIAMTAPVEMDYPGLYADFMKGEQTEANETTMSFLYRSATLGPVGKDGKIVVRDTAPITVLSVGAKGAFDANTEFDALRQWLKSQQEWEVAGDPRMFVYNGPFIDPNARWSEVQVPIRRRDAAAKDAPANAPTPAAPTKPGK